MERIHLTQDRDRLRAVVNSAMNLLFNKLMEISWLAENHLASQEGIYSLGLVSLFSYLLSTFWHFIYIDLFHPSLPWCNSASGPKPPHYRGFMNTLRNTTLGRIPLYEWSAQSRDLYLTTHNNPKRQIPMAPAGFEPTNPASQRPYSYALDRVATDLYFLISANKRH